MFSAVVRNGGIVGCSVQEPIMKKKRGLVDHQRTSTIKGSIHSYEAWTNGNGRLEDGELAELPTANPDVLAEGPSTEPTAPQVIMGEAVEHLQGRQREVYTLIMRESKSLAETGEILGITKSSAATYLERAIKFIAQYCKIAILRRCI